MKDCKVCKGKIIKENKYVLEYFKEVEHPSTGVYTDTHGDKRRWNCSKKPNVDKVLVRDYFCSRKCLTEDLK